MSTEASETCERGRKSAERDHRPGPQAESLSLTLKATPIQVVELRVLEFTRGTSTLLDMRAVPSKKVGPRGDAEGVGVWVGVDIMVTV